MTMHSKWQIVFQVQLLIVILTLTKSSDSLRPLAHPKINDRKLKSDHNDLGTILEILTKMKNLKDSRRGNVANLEKALLIKPVHHKLAKNLRGLRNKKQYLNTAENPGVNEEQAGIDQAELFEVHNKHSSALLDKAYIEKKGKDDFLVMRPDVIDPFVTVIPNDIYYNIEKKCVNWLDDCSIQGIRARLLQKGQSPFK